MSRRIGTRIGAVTIFLGGFSIILESIPQLAYLCVLQDGTLALVDKLYIRWHYQLSVRTYS